MWTYVQNRVEKIENLSYHSHSFITYAAVKEGESSIIAEDALETECAGCEKKLWGEGTDKIVEN